MVQCWLEVPYIVYPDMYFEIKRIENWQWAVCVTLEATAESTDLYLWDEFSDKKNYKYPALCKQIKCDL